MGSVAADAEIPLAPGEALELWTSTARWPTFVEGFARVLERDEVWPGEGGKIVWETNPQGRGRVTEKVLERRKGVLSSRVFEDRLSGIQTASFDGGRVVLELDYELTERGPLRVVADVLFIRRALRDSLRRTVDRFAVEAEEEAGLR